jgi:hypothetical protein
MGLPDAYNAAASVHNSEALLDADTVLQHTAALASTCIALAACFLATQQLDRVPSLGLVLLDPLDFPRSCRQFGSMIFS